MSVTLAPMQLTISMKPDETLLDAARRASVPLGNSCGGVGICARCRVRVVSGADQLSPPTAIESRVSAQRNLAADERLACQTVVLGNCTITTSYW